MQNEVIVSKVVKSSLCVDNLRFAHVAHLLEIQVIWVGYCQCPKNSIHLSFLLQIAKEVRLQRRFGFRLVIGIKLGQLTTLL